MSNHTQFIGGNQDGSSCTGPAADAPYPTTGPTADTWTPSGRAFTTSLVKGSHASTGNNSDTPDCLSGGQFGGSGPPNPPVAVATSGPGGSGFQQVTTGTSLGSSVTITMVDQDKYPKDKEEPMTDMQAPFAKVPWIVRGILAFIVAGISIALAATVSTFFLILLVIALMIVATEEGSGLDR